MNNNENNNINSNVNNNIHQLNDKIRNSENLNNIEQVKIDQLNINNNMQSIPPVGGGSNVEIPQQNLDATQTIVPTTQENSMQSIPPVGASSNVEIPQQNLDATQTIVPTTQENSMQSIPPVGASSNVEISQQNLDATQTIVPIAQENNMQSIPPVSVDSDTEKQQKGNENQVTENNYDENLVKEYVGKNYDKISKQSFNLPAFFFTYIYLFYRKMYAYGFLVILVQFVLLFVPIIKFIAPLTISILLGIFTNKMYVSKVKKDIEKIKANSSNNDYEVLKNKCAKKGGTTVVPVIIVIVVYIVAIVALLLLFIGLITNTKSKIWDIKTKIEENKEKYNDVSEEYDSNITDELEFNGFISYDPDIKIQNEFSLEAPSVFKKDEFFENDYSYNYEYNSENGDYNSCRFSLAKVQGYTSASTFANAVYKYYVQNNEYVLSNNKYGDIDWYNFEYDEFFDTKYYYYITEKADSVYVFEYEIDADAPQDCLTYKDQILNSIKSL